MLKLLGLYLYYPVSGTVDLMDQVSRSGVGTDVTDETASMGEYRWSSDDHEVRYREPFCLPVCDYHALTPT